MDAKEFALEAARIAENTRNVSIDECDHEYRRTPLGIIGQTPKSLCDGCGLTLLDQQWREYDKMKRDEHRQ